MDSPFLSFLDSPPGNPSPWWGHYHKMWWCRWCCVMEENLFLKCEFFLCYRREQGLRMLLECFVGCVGDKKDSNSNATVRQQWLLELMGYIRNVSVKATDFLPAENIAEVREGRWADRGIERTRGRGKRVPCREEEWEWLECDRLVRLASTYLVVGG